MTGTARRLLLVVVIGAAVPVAADESDSWLIVPGERVGAITAASSDDEIARAFGAGNVHRDLIEIGEGEREPGMIVYPDDPEKRLEILWADEAGHRRPSRIQITGAKSAWHLADGITLGTSLTALERLNGRPFLITGFGWDYAGTIVSWEGGALSDLVSDNSRVLLRLTPDYADDRDRELADQVAGDRDFPSDNAAIQAIDPTVEQIVVDFAAP